VHAVATVLVLVVGDVVEVVAFGGDVFCW